jgi:transcription antitermination factor NusG
MNFESKNINWFVIFATNGKVAKFCDYLKSADIEYFYPMRKHERRIRNSERKKQIFQPVFRNLLFVKSSKSRLDPILKEIRLRFGIESDLYYRERTSRKIITIPVTEMQHFIAIAGVVGERIIYMSNKEVSLKAGTKVRITGGLFEGVEGIFMRIKGERRVVVTLPNFLSVATAFIPLEHISPLE